MLAALEVLQIHHLFPSSAVLQAAVVIRGSCTPGPLFAVALSSLTLAPFAFSLHSKSMHFISTFTTLLLILSYPWIRKASVLPTLIYWVDEEAVHPSARAACRCIYTCNIWSSCHCSASQLRSALQCQVLPTANAFYPHETRYFPTLLSSSQKYPGVSTVRSFASYLPGFFFISRTPLF